MLRYEASGQTLRRAFAVFCAISCLAGTARADIAWGVNGHPLVSYPGVSIQRQLDYIVDLGMKSYRVDVPDIRASKRMRPLLDAAKARGIEILPVITPRLDFEKSTPEALEQRAHDLAVAMVRPFKGEIRVWELGNELENYAILQPCEKRDDGSIYDCSFGPAGGTIALDYHGGRWSKVSAVLKGLARGVKAADPAATRAIGTAGWGHVGAFKRLQQDRVPWEITVWHMYGQDPEWALKELDAYGRPIWITEFNAAFGSQKGANVQAQGLVATAKRLKELSKRYRIEAAHVYELLDQTYWAPHHEAYMGLVQLERRGTGWAAGATKPAYAALRELIGPGTPSIIEPVAPPPKITSVRTCSMVPVKGGKSVSATALVTYAYCLVLGRAADGAGLTAYTKRIHDELDVEGLVLELLASDEFQRKFDVDRQTDEAFIVGMHELLLDHVPPDIVRNAALKALAATVGAGGGRTAFVKRLIGSREFRVRHDTLYKPIAKKQTAQALPPPVPEARRHCTPGAVKETNTAREKTLLAYCLVLGRWPDGHGLLAWSDAVKNGLSFDGLLLRLLYSSEFMSRYRIDALTNQDFVTLCYRLLLGRDPDAASHNSYATSLSQGRISRREFYALIIASDEFRQHRDALIAMARSEDKARLPGVSSISRMR
ncbi:MAG: DUF4214 domain-containing protein [Hyphomicrobiaceae bacterium]|nr:DUF4214 domain-containing protein [Hyphomicrobiaceae bacterium]